MCQTQFITTTHMISVSKLPINMPVDGIIHNTLYNQKHNVDAHVCGVRQENLMVFVFYTLHRYEETISKKTKDDGRMTHDYNVRASQSDRRASEPCDDSNIASVATRQERLCDWCKFARSAEIA